MGKSVIMSDQIKRVQEMIKALSSNKKSPGGLAALAGMLSQMDRQTERRILDAVEKEDPELAKKLQKHHFAFEDMVRLDDAVVKKALSQVHRSTLALALKGADEPIRQKVYKNLSKNAAEDLQYDMGIMGPKPRSMVEEAQEEVTAVLRGMKNLIL